MKRNNRCTCRKLNHNEAVSPVVGEMLMLTLTLLLVSLFAVSLSNFIPEERTPSVNIMTGYPDESGMNITLWHKGGDILPKTEMRVIISNRSVREVIAGASIIINDDPSVMNFMPGDYMTVACEYEIYGREISITAKNAVLFTGRAGERN